MKKRRSLIKRISLILCCIFMGVISSASHAKEVIDQAGRTVQVPEMPQRVIALAPSIAEMVCSLGRCDLLKGVTRFSDYPEEVKEMPRVGTYVQLDIERIIALKPDLCIGIKDGNPKHIVDRIEAAGIPVYVIDPRNLQDIIEVVLQLGTILGTQEKAEYLARDMTERMERVRTQIATSDTKPKVFFQIDAAPIVSAGHNTFVNELITLAGGVNLADGQAAYPRFSWEEVLMLAPEVVVVTSMAGGYPAEQLLADWNRWHQIPAVTSKRVHVVDAGLFDRPTARLVGGLEALASIIHPELFDKDSTRENLQPDNLQPEKK